MKKMFKSRKKTAEAVADNGAVAVKTLKPVKGAVGKRVKNTKAGDIPL